MAASNEDGCEDGCEVSNCIMTTLISFNFGIMQDMLDDGPWQKKHKKKFAYLMDMFAHVYCADILLGCEVGAHKAGMHTAQQKAA